jgi:hypothetical protein
MKKKLLLIGNKPLDKDYSDEISDYDMVVRVNRMTNFDQSSGKCDLWVADIHETAVPLFQKELQDKFIQAKRAIVFEHSKNSTQTYLKNLSYENEITILPFDSIPINKYISVYDYNVFGMRVTNIIWALIYCLENFSSEYDIYVLGISDRFFLKSPIHCWHNKIYMAEDYFYKSLITDGRIISLDKSTPLEEDTQAIPKYTHNIPLFSSFWHSEIDILPKMVTASINSFVKNGCPYHLYTYKEYKNIPSGCIVKDANEIVPISQFFIGSRGDYASFADMFRVFLVNTVDTAWTDTDNFFITDDFPTKTFFIIQDGRLQNSTFYIENTDKGKIFKKKLLEFYESPSTIRDYDNEEMKNAKNQIKEYETKKEQLSHAKWGIGGSCLFTNIHENVDMSDYLYDYTKYFNGFNYSEHFQLYNYKEDEYMKYYNRNVKILTMSMALFQRNPEILAHFNNESYAGKLYEKYTSD